MVPGQYGTNVRTASNPGLALVDTKGVTLRGLEIRGFCIGVLVLRTSNAVIADNRIVRNIGGAGVMLSGDDGKGGSTSNTTLDNKVLRNLLPGERRRPGADARRGLQPDRRQRLRRRDRQSGALAGHRDPVGQRQHRRAQPLRCATPTACS
jgi:hypothetical protein